jgi:hypothetical protein
MSNSRMYVPSILRKKFHGVVLLHTFLVSSVFFALFDGIFYHTVRITMYLIAAAYISAETIKGAVYVNTNIS